VTIADESSDPAQARFRRKQAIDTERNQIPVQLRCLMSVFSCSTPHLIRTISFADRCLDHHLHRHGTGKNGGIVTTHRRGDTKMTGIVIGGGRSNGGMTIEVDTLGHGTMSTVDGIGMTEHADPRETTIVIRVLRIVVLRRTERALQEARP